MDMEKSPAWRKTPPGCKMNSDVNFETEISGLKNSQA
jgi:hypothetical protein